MPLIGIAPWSEVAYHEELEGRPNGQVYLYGSWDHRHSHRGSKNLEPNHTHFLMVDDGDEATTDDEWPLRAALERWVCAR